MVMVGFLDGDLVTTKIHLKIHLGGGSEEEGFVTSQRIAKATELIEGGLYQNAAPTHAAHLGTLTPTASSPLLHLVVSHPSRGSQGGRGAAAASPPSR